MNIDTDKHLAAIVAVINTTHKAPRAELKDGQIFLNGDGISNYFRWDEYRTKIHAYRSVGTGRYFLNVHGWGWKAQGGYSQPAKVLPIRKDGSLNYEEAASMFLLRYAHESYREGRNKIAEGNRPLANRLRDEFSFNFGRIMASDVSPNRVRVEITMELTEEQARAIYRILRPQSTQE